MISLHGPGCEAQHLHHEKPPVKGWFFRFLSLSKKVKCDLNSVVLNFLTDLIFPKICLSCGKLGEHFCAECRAKVKSYSTYFCPVCGKAAIDGLTHPKCRNRYSLDGVFCLFGYDFPLTKTLHQLKYRFSSSLVNDLEKLVKESNVDLPTNFTKKTLIPVPLAKSRENWRGFNQAELLARVISRTFELKLEENFMIRTKFAKPQMKLKLVERKENVKGVFEVIDETKVKGAKIILFDDVWTTGTTLREAGKVLKQKGATEVYAMVFASPHKV